MVITTVASLIVAIFAILPGVPADWIYASLIGSDWRMKDWERIVRILIFSVLGLVVYSSLANAIGLPQPIYVLPTTFSSGGFQQSDLSDASIAYVGHWVCSAMVALAAGGIVRLVGQTTPASAFPSSWDVFIRRHAPSHWVVVAISGGGAYAGILSSAELSVPKEERDIVLEEPAKYDENSNNYVALPYSSLFLPSSLISSIAAVHDPDHDERITEIGRTIFTGGNYDAG